MPVPWPNTADASVGSVCEIRTAWSRAEIEMLKQRVITALLMAGLFLSAVVYLPVSGIALLLGLLIGAGAWEWSSLAGWQQRVARSLYVLLVLAALVAVYSYCQLGDLPQREQVQPLLGVACLWWACALLLVQGYPGSAVLWRNVVMRSADGNPDSGTRLDVRSLPSQFPPGGIIAGGHGGCGGCGGYWRLFCGQAFW